LLKRLRRLEGVVEELSGQVEIESSRQSRGGEGDSANTSNTNPVRVVGMDEGMASTKAWAGRMLDVGGGPPAPDRIENELGKLVIDEGKSAYVSNAFWARYVIATALGINELSLSKLQVPRRGSYLSLDMYPF
jgi:hypothetical protein